MPHSVEARMQQLRGVNPRSVARVEPPQDAVHGVASARLHRSPPLDTDEKPVILKRRHTERPRARTTLLHRGTVHIGAIGKIKGHAAAATTIRQTPGSLHPPPDYRPACS